MLLSDDCMMLKNSHMDRYGAHRFYPRKIIVYYNCVGGMWGKFLFEAGLQIVLQGTKKTSDSCFRVCPWIGQAVMSLLKIVLTSYM